MKVTPIILSLKIVKHLWTNIDAINLDSFEMAKYTCILYLRSQNSNFNIGRPEFFGLLLGILIAEFSAIPFLHFFPWVWNMSPAPYEHCIILTTRILTNQATIIHVCDIIKFKNCVTYSSAPKFPMRTTTTNTFQHHNFLDQLTASKFPPEHSQWMHTPI